MSHSTRFDITLGVHSDPSQCLLMLQVLEEGLRLLVVDQEKHPLLYRLIQFDRSAVELDSALVDWLRENHQWLQSWSEIVVVHQGIQAAVIPAAVFHEENSKELLDLQYGDLFRGTTLTDLVAGREDYVIYRVPTSWYHALSDANNKVRHRHFFSLWIKWLDGLPKDPAIGQAYLMFETNRVAMAIRRDEWLLLQQYEYHVPEDISYFLLSALEQFNMSPETVHVTLDGWIDVQSALYLELYKYIRNLDTVKLPDSVQLDRALLQDQPEHYFTPLIQMATCV